MPHRALLEELEYAQARQRRLQPYRLEIGGRAHRSSCRDRGRSVIIFAFMHARIILAALALASLAACSGSWLPNLPLGPLKPYRIDIQQGNVVTQEMIAKVQPGMTRGQVRFALGTPLVADVFHPDRWDYVYQYQKAGVVTEHRRIVVVFKGDNLVRIEGDVVPASSLPGAAKSGKPEKPAAPAPVAPPQELSTSGGSRETSPPWPR